MKRKCQEIKDDSTKMVEVLSGDRQALWSMPCLSTMARFVYFGQLTPPCLSKPVADSLDTHLWNILQAAVVFTVPRGENWDTVTFQ